ncbi:TRAP-type C4-dicarboxylate transport system, small permease component [Sulfitobacter brevis]|uniref:TRAP transporter small permease protein n=1 Tax=Sulfitobacter brevis TaxID=74348 RepID=A0A1I2GIK8_9RHOB|nr:TRAP transporter small permease [Sulfitobacter brevis]SFF16461.1 TRAP-type C4-dicarboxylate transport system, small permease component [Sulfitobacter brevis]
MQILNRFLNFVSDVLGAIAMLFLAFLMFGTTFDVVVRAITGSPITGVFEFTELALVMVVFLGAGWAHRGDAHIRVTILTDKLSSATRARVVALAWGIGALGVLILAIPATNEAIYSVSIREYRWGYVKIPIWWTKASLATGLWFAFIQMAVQSVQLFLFGEPAPNAAKTGTNRRQDL